MRAVDLIRIKREGGNLSSEEIEFLIDGYVAGEIPDYQVAAWLMAVYYNGMNAAELATLTQSMMNSGDVYDLSDIPGVKADKHSTGGVGDKVSLMLAPLAAACGAVVPMISGRGLGHTGGTLDKLEAIPGFSTNLSAARFKRQLKQIGLAMGGQTKKFVPADRKLYALRDVTCTVESIPLISASIMSKKLAEGCDVLVLDVKTGSGAFMRKQADAEKLARTMVAIGRKMGRKVSAMITDMSQPLGCAVGNANEVVESIEVLKGGGPADLVAVTRALTARMLVLGKLAKNDKEAGVQMDKAIASGAALEKFREMVETQGGDPRCVDHPEKILPQAKKKKVITAPRSGYLTEFNTLNVGLGACVMGAGRAVVADKIDPGVGLWVRARVGDKITKGQPIYEVYYNDTKRFASAKSMLENSFKISSKRVRPPRLIRKSEV